MLTVAELPSYISEADRLLSGFERQDIVAYLSYNPKAGVLIRGSGGIRKLRWGRGGQGKSGGVRVIYYFHNEHMPLYLITVFGKGEKDNLTRQECNDLSDLAKNLVGIWLEKRK
jgi:mRNA-degrading endonuclease RelE of RelBE toxin-antitoxin system